ncbi:MAG: CHAT domain-containing protein, partial [Caldilineaceae bacterium]|nr:CHAT domain-containing protein [Caldilineaceae bacterium]
MNVYENFDLLITQHGGGYSAHVIASPVGQERHDFTLDFTEQELRTFFWLSGRALRLVRLVATSATSSALTPTTFGERLYDAVVAGPVRTQLRRSLDAVAAQDKGLRIRLWLSHVPELAELPWEYLYATDLGRALANATETPVVRYLDLAEPEAIMTMRPPLRILGIVSDPSDAPHLNVEQEWRQLHDALADLASRGLVTLERLSEPTVAALQRRLRRDPIHVVHFIGHGDFVEERGGALLFEDESGASRPISAEELAMLLQSHRSLRLAFLNACQGAQSAHTNPFAGVAQKLVQQGLPSVLAMQFPVSDRSAITLAREFYRALA